MGQQIYMIQSISYLVLCSLIHFVAWGGALATLQLDEVVVRRSSEPSAVISGGGPAYGTAARIS